MADRSGPARSSHCIETHGARGVGMLDLHSEPELTPVSA